MAKSKRTLTAEQKQWVRERDKFACVICGSPDDIHVHHLLSHRLMNYATDYIENPILLCCICSAHHIRGIEGDIFTAIHPDIAYALSTYSKNGQDGFKRVFERREKKLRRLVTDKPLWNHDYDAQLLHYSIYATLDYLKVKKWPRDK